MLGKRTLAGQVNTKQASITDFKIDKDGPRLDISYKKEDGSEYTPGTWSNQNVVVKVDYRDEESWASCPSFEGITGHEQGTDTSWSITTGTDGKYESATVSCSDAVNTTTVNLGKIWVDTTPPVASITEPTDGWCTSTDKPTYSASDYGSGLATLKIGTVVNLTDINEQSVRNKFTPGSNTEGRQTFSCTVKDVAGSEYRFSEDLKLDYVKPVINLNFNVSTREERLSSGVVVLYGTLKVNGTVTDQGSGVESVRLSSKSGLASSLPNILFTTNGSFPKQASISKVGSEQQVPTGKGWSVTVIATDHTQNSRTISRPS